MSSIFTTFKESFLVNSAFFPLFLCFASICTRLLFYFITCISVFTYKHQSLHFPLKFKSHLSLDPEASKDETPTPSQKLPCTQDVIQLMILLLPIEATSWYNSWNIISNNYIKYKLIFVQCQLSGCHMPLSTLNLVLSLSKITNCFMTSKCVAKQNKKY